MRLLLYVGIILAVTVAFWALPLHGQDDNGAPPPVQDQGAPAPDDQSDDSDDSSASFQTFYDALSSQGTWIQNDDYGYVWQPQVDDPDWAPYTEGHWVYTDAGWTWASDESFGWATYHYGRWVNLDGTGWVWVPGYTWAPAWVSWRYGGGYAGWAPLPPDSFVGVDYSDDGLSIGVAFHIGGDCDGFYGIGAGCYNFLPVTCLGYRNYHGYYSHRGDNFAIINRTTNVTNINVATSGTARAAGFSRVTTGGPMLAQVNAASSTPVPQANLVRTGHLGEGGTISGNSLAVYAPRVRAVTAAQPASVAGTIGRASINRGADVLRPLAVNSRVAGAAATEAQVQEARIAQDHAPANAKVMTDVSAVRPVLQTPLTAMKPVTVAQRTYTTAPASPFSNGTRGPVVTPAERTYPQTSEPGNAPAHVYYPNTEPRTAVPQSQPYYAPRPATTTPGTYVRPSAPANSYTPAPSPQVVHPNQGGGSNGGGASPYHSSGNGSGSYHSGGNSQQGH